jgi:hypothetical protein
VRFLALILVAVSAASQEPPRCPPLPGAGQLFSLPELRFLLVGEMHGTAETPAIFADLVCAAARATKRPIIAAVELHDRRAIDRFLASGDRVSLLASEEWKGKDGRTSAAMLSLLDRLRALKSGGMVSSVVAFSVARSGEPPAIEEHMAGALLQAAGQSPGALVIALTGNAHASKSVIPQIGPHRPMASFLPAAQTVSLLAADRGGQAWNCQSDGCGPHPLKSSGESARGVTLTSPHSGYDGVLSTGLPATPSLPAVP